jgi:hypothetical protein
MRCLPRTLFSSALLSLVMACLLASGPVRLSGTELHADPEDRPQTQKDPEQAVADARRQGGKGYGDRLR